MIPFRAVRLGAADVALAKVTFSVMAEVFGESSAELGDAYVARILDRPDFWAMAAIWDGTVVGGITAHTLPMTRSESSELFIYDLAVLPSHQRKGIGRELVAALRAAAAVVGITDAFVPADNEDVHALDFYRALEGAPVAVTIFTFTD